MSITHSKLNIRLAQDFLQRNYAPFLHDEVTGKGVPANSTEMEKAPKEKA